MQLSLRLFVAARWFEATHPVQALDLCLGGHEDRQCMVLGGSSHSCAGERRDSPPERYRLI